MIQETKSIKNHIDMALEDILQDQYRNIQLKEAKRLILDYVFQYADPEPDGNRRYEWYYQLMGKAVAIAQGWKLNSLNALTDPDDTLGNLRSYVKGTYGGKIASGA